MNKPTPYEILGWTGIVIAFVSALALAPSFDLERSVIGWLFLLGLFSAYLFNVIQLFFRKEPEHSLYHYFLLLLASNAAVSAISGTPYTIVSDSFLISFSITAGFGRIGCFTAECCFGKSFKNRRLPTQMIESVFHFLNAGTGIYFCLFASFSNGTIAMLLTASYAIFRFFTEFLRGDERPYFIKLSEAQWTAILLLILISVLLVVG